MPRRESQLMTRGVELVRGGRKQTEVAALLGIDRGALIRACQRAGVVVPRGRPWPARTPG